ncbi:MAG TPA: response regulator [Flavisolibacter sp.]
MNLVPGQTHLAVNSVVLADDDRDDHDFFSSALKEISPSIQLSIVKDGSELLALLKHYMPDFVFLDLDMPSKTGLECLLEIRHDPKLKNMPVVVFSSTSRPANITTAYDMGADLFLIKPHTYHDLVSAIRGVFSLNWSAPSEIKKQFCVNGAYTAYTTEQTS